MVMRFEKMSGDDWRRTAAEIRRGGLVCLPTDTVYGVACDPANRRAMDRLYDAKGRDRGKPFSLMFTGIGQMRSALPELPETLWRQVAALLPGPVTVILPDTGGSVGARTVPPRFAQAYSLLPLPLAMTSANLSGGSDPRTVAEIPAAITAVCGMVVDAGPCELGRPTTVVDMRPLASGDLPVLLREGALDRVQVEKSIGECT